MRIGDDESQNWKKILISNGTSHILYNLFLRHIVAIQLQTNSNAIIMFDILFIIASRFNILNCSTAAKAFNLYVLILNPEISPKRYDLFAFSFGLRTTRYWYRKEIGFGDSIIKYQTIISCFRLVFKWKNCQKWKKWYFSR
jgi:hypothetical protein